MARTPSTPSGLPSEQEILTLVRSTKGFVGRREIARAFGLNPSQKRDLRRLIRDLTSRGLLTDDGNDAPRNERGSEGEANSGPRTDTGTDIDDMPAVSIHRVMRIDGDGIAWTKAGHNAPEAAELVEIETGGKPRPGSALAEGDRVLVRITHRGPSHTRGRVLRRLAAAPEQVVGIYEKTPTGGKVRPVGKKSRFDISIESKATNGAQSGELVAVRVKERDRLGLTRGEVVERLESESGPGSIGLIALHENDIPIEFSAEALSQAEAAKPVKLGKRAELRDTPLVTIDGSDARDFDDAVWAKADDDPSNSGGWRILVAIADVAHYVRSGDALDRDAFQRGNSVYLPDRVVPMLPEALSNGLCSLKPHEDRACLAVEMVIRADGSKVGHEFRRGLMRSHARLTYEQVQAIQDGTPLEGTPPDLPSDLIPALYAASSCLLAARAKRGALEIDLPERRITLGKNGEILEIGQRDRLESHKLIEEFMVLANVCAAETLEQRKTACMYRVHDEPNDMKLDALRTFLESIDLKLARGQVIQPQAFNSLLTKVAGTEHETMVNEMVLRSQSPAIYSPDNHGHFGLGLQRYAHFTSPIRRYSDLLVHRGLIAALGFGNDGLRTEDGAQFVEWGEQISATERRAVVAERSTLDRYVSIYLADRVGQMFDGVVGGVTKAGLFVSIADGMGDAFLPFRYLPNDRFDLDPDSATLVGRTTGLTFRFGDAIEGKLIEADTTTGGLMIEYMSGGTVNPVQGGRASKAGKRSHRDGKGGGKGGSKGAKGRKLKRR